LRQWVEQPGPFPQGVARAWFAIEGKAAWCGIFQLVNMGNFMLSYHKIGDPPTTEHFISFDQAQERAIWVLNQGGLISRRALITS